MAQPPEERIEILSVALLDRHRPHVEAFKRLARSLGLEFGWHYLLDLAWIAGLLGPVEGQRIMDAGAGTGILQWYLADGGAQVLSVDRTSRANLPLRFRSRFRVKGLRPQDLNPPAQVLRANLSRPVSWSTRIASQARELAGLVEVKRRAPGQVLIYNQDLRTLVDIPSDSLDAIVAVSALEHNTPDGLVQVVAELLRVLKPGGVLLATLGAACDEDWFHEPSKGWCYTEASLRRLFSLPENAPSNYSAYPELMEALRGCAELRDNLAGFYRRSGDNGMPWGVWDPQYQSVGVCKRKP